MKRTVKFLACLLAVSALAVACGNDEEGEDTTAVDTPEVIDTPAIDSAAMDTTAIDSTAAEPAKVTKTNTGKKDKTNKLNTTDNAVNKAGKTGSKADQKFQVKTGDPNANTMNDQGLENNTPTAGKKRNF